MIVDTHTHACPWWMEPIELLDYQMRANKVNKALLMPLRDVFDMDYLYESARRFPGQFHVVGAVDHRRDDAADQLARQAAQGVVAVRFDAQDRSPGKDPLLIWSAAASLGLPISTMGHIEHFLSPEFQRIIEAYPQVPIVLEHLAGAGAFWGPGRADKQFPMDLYKAVLGLARYPHVHMKMPGFAEFMPRPRPLLVPVFPTVLPAYEMAVDAFGASRLMWGSDFPPSANREGYGSVLGFPRDQVKWKSESDRDWVFGKTAVTVFKLAS